MPRRRTLSDAGLAALRPRAARYVVPDPELRGHYVRIAPTGVKSFVTVARDPNGKKVWTTIGPADLLPIDEARRKARDVLTRVRDGLPALDAPKRPSTFQDIAEQWLKRHVEVNELRSK